MLKIYHSTLFIIILFNYCNLVFAEECWNDENAVLIFGELKCWKDNDRSEYSYKKVIEIDINCDDISEFLAYSPPEYCGASGKCNYVLLTNKGTEIGSFFGYNLEVLNEKFNDYYVIKIKEYDTIYYDGYQLGYEEYNKNLKKNRRFDLSTEIEQIYNQPHGGHRSSICYYRWNEKEYEIYKWIDYFHGDSHYNDKIAPYEDVIDKLSSSIKSGTITFKNYCERGFAYWRKNDYKSAISDFERALQIRKDPVLYHNIGLMWFQVFDSFGCENHKTTINRAIDYFEKSLNMGISNPKSTKRLYANCLFIRGTIWLNNGLYRIIHLNKSLEGSISKTKKNKGFKYRKNKNVYRLALNDIEKAISNGKQLSAKESDIYADLLLKRAKNNNKIQNYNGVIQDYEKAISYGINLKQSEILIYSKLLLYRGKNRFKEEDYYGGTQDFEIALSFDENILSDEEIETFFGIGYFEIGKDYIFDDVNMAIQCFEDAITNGKKLSGKESAIYADVLIIRASNRNQVKNYKSSINDFENAFAYSKTLKKEDVSIYADSLLKERFKIKDYNFLIQDFKKGISFNKINLSTKEIKTLFANGYFEIGKDYISEDANMAIQYFENSISLGKIFSTNESKIYAEALVKQGLERYYNNECDKAIQLYNKAKKISSQDVSFYDNLVSAYRCDGKLMYALITYVFYQHLYYFTLFCYIFSCISFIFILLIKIFVKEKESVKPLSQSSLIDKNSLLYKVVFVSTAFMAFPIYVIPITVLFISDKAEICIKELLYISEFLFVKNYKPTKWRKLRSWIILCSPFLFPGLLIYISFMLLFSWFILNLRFLLELINSFLNILEKVLNFLGTIIKDVLIAIMSWVKKTLNFFITIFKDLLIRIQQF